jgi:uncharacterized membrane protein YhhN
VRAGRAAAGRAPAAVLAAALVYVVALSADIGWLRLLAKPLPALLLAVWVAWRGHDLAGRLVTAGLVLSAVGDAVLELRHFLPGLVAFLLAHMAYVAGFVASDSRPALLRALPFAAWGAGALLLLWPGLGAMAVPVVAYVTVIATMMWRAAARVGGRTPPRAAWIGLGGSMAFAASDTILAFDRFSSPIPGASWPIMVLYWLGQWGIAASAAASSRPGTGMLPAR